ncbi:NACHT domain-containing protein [Paractinoplanes globisporus]|uniref:NACHT domain-containing protein n=1 Tax=Paractinoplanes globisporus TaxID=113565 RepID=A0ABW6W6Z2_9ACTN|nr:AAA family ATPase [Actinoplanes globisporus]
MPKGLSYADAVRILGGKGPLAKAIDNLLGGALSVATLGGSSAALGFFDAKSEMVRLSGLLTASLNDSVRGLGRYDRSQRLLAAHCMLAVAAFFEALDECLAAASLSSSAPGSSSPPSSSPDPSSLSREEQVTQVGGPPGEGLVYRLLTAKIPMPSADRPYAGLLDDLADWYFHQANRVFVSDARLLTVLHDRLPRRAVERYDESRRRLAEEIPEFAIWAGHLEDRAAARGLERLEAVLVRATSGRDPGVHRAALSRAYRAELDRPVLGGEAGDLALPTLGEAYVDPRFRVKAAGPGARPSAEHWWDTDVRADFPTFLAAYLTTDQATEAPMLLLGQPGAGKSSLTRILAARLPASDFLVARVPLREVAAEAGIQDQVEQALRAAIGETVAWAALTRDAGDALPVILLDGFDELLQATGLHQSDYLRRVAEFQRREAAVGRPVAVMVTSRITMADWARLPDGALVVRLEPFDDEQIARWAEVWNDANRARFAAAGREPLDLEVLVRFRDLAGQPLLLLMLALYDAAGNALRDDAASLDTGQLYERLLSRFAAREIERVYSGRPDGDVAELVEEELVRLSAVAFALFNRNRLWVSERELDDDLAGLDLTPSRVAAGDSFRSPLTAAQETVGRFFFIQRAQALRDDKILHTYEFLHATFGEYLVARLLVRSLREVVALEAVGVRGPRLRRPREDDLIQALLGYTPLTARNTVLPFIRGLIAPDERLAMRASLVRRAIQAVNRPSHTPGPYRPVEKRVDHWMATYSFNVVLLVLACGGELRATELFTGAADPADWLRGSALQWRAAIPGGMWLEALESLTVRREWHEGRRDLVIGLGRAGVTPIEPDWSNRIAPGTPPPTYLTANFALGPALKSMNLSNNLSDDALLHALEPLLRRAPSALGTFVTEDDRTESMAHALIHLWMTSTSDAGPVELTRAYQRAASVAEAIEHPDSRLGLGIVLRSLLADAHRLRPSDVIAILGKLAAHIEAPDVPPVLEYLLTTANTPDRIQRLERLLLHYPDLDELSRTESLRLLLGPSVDTSAPEAGNSSPS